MIPEAWLFDAPLFIDEVQIKSLYNAVALPEFEEESRDVSLGDLKVSQWKVGGHVKVSAADSLLAKLLAPIAAEAQVDGERSGGTTEKKDRTIHLGAVDAPERRLLNLALYYGANLTDRVWSVDGLDDLAWLADETQTTKLPKPLIFLDVASDFPIVPMAAELTDGKVVLFFSRISEAVSPGQTPPPDYPRDERGVKMNEYWSWFQNDKAQDRDTSQLVMRVVEEVVGAGGRPRWIDYRVPLGVPGSQERSLHLHIKGRENYDTGDFAYQLLRRGRKHGFRVVGTLKSGPALNVLALYEK
jgi:hypothetical protein